MKPRNFPGRKVARRLAAQSRALGWSGVSCTSLDARDEKWVAKARAIRTKKNRSV